MERTILATIVAAVLVLGCGAANTIQPNTGPQGPPDVDQDNIPDEIDECITEKEDGLMPRPKDGCKTNPDDPDGDNIAQLDKCPKEPENINGYEDEDGCPDKIPEVVVDVKKQELRCDARVLFEPDKAVIVKASDELVDNVAQALKDHPEIQFVEVAGHADKTGNDAHNVTLTKDRAQAVVDALINRGIDSSRLRAMGYGRYCPLDTSGTEQARNINRRVEFKVMLIDGTETGVKLGCDEAQARGIKPEGVPQTTPRTPNPSP